MGKTRQITTSEQLPSDEPSEGSAFNRKGQSALSVDQPLRTYFTAILLSTLQCPLSNSIAHVPFSVLIIYVQAPFYSYS